MIELREYQKLSVEKIFEDLSEKQTALCVAPTGSGKTVILSEVVGRSAKTFNQRTLVLQHREELLDQNRKKFQDLFPEVTTSLVNAKIKDTSGQVVFAMVQTLCRQKNLPSLPRFDLVTIDEAHHIAAHSYGKILSHLRDLNPSLRLLGVTATPNRGDKKKLSLFFKKVSHQIYLRDLVLADVLVPPLTYSCDMEYTDNLRDLLEQQKSDQEKAALIASTRKKDIKKAGYGELEDSFSVSSDAVLQTKASVLMDTPSNNQKIVEEWKRLASGRPTVLFATRVSHAENLQKVFQESGIEAAHVNGEMSSSERGKNLTKFVKGEATVITNVAVLTEGWDYPPTSCVILCRPSSFKSTYIQMVGRGLRAYDGKEDCLVLDFGLSSERYGNLEQDVQLEPKKQCQCCQQWIDAELKECPHCGHEFTNESHKLCPECEAEIPLASKTCPMCGYEFSGDVKSEISDVTKLVKQKFIRQSNFEWRQIEDSQVDKIEIYGVSTFQKSGFIVKHPALSLAFGINKINNEKSITVIKTGHEIKCLYALDSYITEGSDAALIKRSSKNSDWFQESVTEKQKTILQQFLPLRAIDTLDRYRASVNIEYFFNKNKILKFSKDLLERG